MNIPEIFQSWWKPTLCSRYILEKRSLLQCTTLFIQKSCADPCQIRYSISNSTANAFRCRRHRHGVLSPRTKWGQYFWSHIWIVCLIWDSVSLVILYTYMEVLVCWSVSDKIFNLQVHFWCLLLLSPSLSSAPGHNGAILLWSLIQTLFILFVWSGAQALWALHINTEAHAVITNFQVHIRGHPLLTLLSWRFCPQTHWGSSIFSNRN